MKKFFGTLLLIFALIIIIVSCVAATEIDCEKKSLFSQARTELDYGYRSSLESSQATAMFAALFGLILFIIGLVLLLTKSKRQKELEAEVISLKYIKENSVQTETVNELESLYALKQKGILTEEEFVAAKKKLLN